MPFEETTQQREPIERVAENEDTLAEAQMLGDADVQSAKNRIISQFDTSTTGIAEIHEMMPQLRATMDELIQKTVIRLVNVRDINDLPPEKLAEIQEVIEIRLEEFRKTVEEEAEKNNGDAVASAKEKKERWFEEKVLVRRGTNNDAELKFSVGGKIDQNGAIKTPETVTVDYIEKDPKRPKVTLTVETNERFFSSEAKTTENPTEKTVATRIGQNKESGTYRIGGTNDKIKDPEAFKTWILAELQKLNIDPKTASTQQLTLAATDIVRRNLKIFKDVEKAFGDLPADKIPVDQLLQTHEKGCCRHFTVATRVVFEQIQQITREQQNHGLDGIIAFENEMDEMGHATLAFARGNEITTIDPFWYAAGIQRTPDSTFDGRHGNFTSLYRTLSKAPAGNPEASIFDQGSSEKLVRELHSNDGQIPKEIRDKVDNPAQAMIMRTRELILNPILQTPENILATVRSLKATLSGLNPSQPEDELALASIIKLSPLIAELIALKMADAEGKTVEYSSKLSLAGVLLDISLNAILERKNPDKTEEKPYEKLIEKCEKALLDQRLDKEAKQEILKTTAEEMLNSAWEKISFILLKAKEISIDGIYQTVTENGSQFKDATITLLNPTLEIASKVMEFINEKGIWKTEKNIMEDIKQKSTTLDDVSVRVQGTFAEKIAIRLKDKFKVT